MDLRLTIRELDPPHSVVVAVAGVSSRGDVARLEAAAADARVRAADRIVLDLRSLGSVSPHLVRAVVAWQRALTDRGASLVCLGANSVIRWRLARTRGTLPLPETESMDEARNLPLDRLPDVAVGGDLPPEELDGEGRPRTGLSAGLDAHGGDPGRAVIAALRSSGLAERAIPVPVRGGRLQAPAELGDTERGGGLLQALEAAPGAVAVDELDRSACGTSELALLHWSGADLLLPLRGEGRLLGMLAVVSGRRGGLTSYRSGEVLALELLARWYARRLANADDAPHAPEPEPEEALAAVPLEAV